MTKKKTIEEGTVSKEEVLAGIEKALIELKLIQEGKKKGKDINEFLNEIQDQHSNRMEEETISKEKILAGIEKGLIELKKEQEGEKGRFRDINELLNEL